MDDAFLVRGVEGIGDLPRIAERRLKRQRPFRRLPLDELHHEVVGSDVVQRADIGMVQGRDGPHLALGSLAELLGGHLDGHVPTDAGITCAIHLAHAAGADSGGDFVGAEPRARG